MSGKTQGPSVLGHHPASRLPLPVFGEGTTNDWSKGLLGCLFEAKMEPSWKPLLGTLLRHQLEIEAFATAR